MLVLTRKESEEIICGGFFKIVIVEIYSNRKSVRIGIEAPDWLRFYRSELLTTPFERKPLQINGDMTPEHAGEFTQLESEIGRLGCSLCLQNAADVLPKMQWIVSQAEQLVNGAKP